MICQSGLKWLVLELINKLEVNMLQISLLYLRNLFESRRVREA